VAVVFDTKGPTFRHREYPSTRRTARPCRTSWDARSRSSAACCASSAFRSWSRKGWRPTTSWATLATEAAKSGIDVWILTSDKDFFQIVSTGSVFSDPGPRGRGGDDRPRGVKARYGVDPEQMVDLLAPDGDSVDNVPGVPGVGRRRRRS